MIGPKIRRLYYSAKEIADELDMSVAQLTAIERRFPQIKSTKHRSGRRLFKPEDFDLIRKIHALSEEGYHDNYITAMLWEGPDRIHRPVRKMELLLSEITADLEDIRDLLDENSRLLS